MKTRTLIIGFILIVLFDLLCTSCSENEIPEDPEPQTSSATLEIKVDNRIELLAVVQHFTTWAAKRHTKLDIAYKNEVEEYFAPYANHAAVQQYQDLIDDGFTYHIPPAYILCHSSLPALEQVHDYSPELINRGGSKHQLEQLAIALKDFAEESNFMGFWESHQSFYAQLENDIKSNLKDRKYAELLENYYGEYKQSYALLAAPLFHAGGYAATIEAEEGDLVYSIQGPLESEAGMPVYGDADWFKYVTLHEFSHAFVNPLTSSNWYQVKQSQDLYTPIQDEMAQMAYTNWFSCVNEHLVRVNVARFALALEGEAAKNEILESEFNKGFRYIYELDTFMEVYEKDRDNYKSYRDFYPEIIKCFEDLNK